MKFSACFQDDGIIDSLLILRLRYQRVGLVCFTLISVEMGKLVMNPSFQQLLLFFFRGSLEMEMLN